MSTYLPSPDRFRNTTEIRTSDNSHKSESSSSDPQLSVEARIRAIVNGALDFCKWLRK